MGYCNVLILATGYNRSRAGGEAGTMVPHFLQRAALSIKQNLGFQHSTFKSKWDRKLLCRFNHGEGFLHNLKSKLNIMLMADNLQTLIYANMFIKVLPGYRMPLQCAAHTDQCAFGGPAVWICWLLRGCRHLLLGGNLITGNIQTVELNTLVFICFF